MKECGGSGCSGCLAEGRKNGLGSLTETAEGGDSLSKMLKTVGEQRSAG